MIHLFFVLVCILLLKPSDELRLLSCLMGKIVCVETFNDFLDFLIFDQELLEDIVRILEWSEVCVEICLLFVSISSKIKNPESHLIILCKKEEDISFVILIEDLIVHDAVLHSLVNCFVLWYFKHRPFKWIWNIEIVIAMKFLVKALFIFLPKSNDSQFSSNLHKILIFYWINRIWSEASFAIQFCPSWFLCDMNLLIRFDYWGRRIMLIVFRNFDLRTCVELVNIFHLTEFCIRSSLC